MAQVVPALDLPHTLCMRCPALHPPPQRPTPCPPLRPGFPMVGAGPWVCRAMPPSPGTGCPACRPRAPYHPAPAPSWRDGTWSQMRTWVTKTWPWWEMKVCTVTPTCFTRGGWVWRHHTPDTPSMSPTTLWPTIAVPSDHRALTATPPCSLKCWSSPCTDKSHGSTRRAICPLSALKHLRPHPTGWLTWEWSIFILTMALTFPPTPSSLTGLPPAASPSKRSQDCMCLWMQKHGALSASRAWPRQCPLPWTSRLLAMGHPPCPKTRRQGKAELGLNVCKWETFLIRTSFVVLDSGDNVMCRRLLHPAAVFISCLSR